MLKKLTTCLLATAIFAGHAPGRSLMVPNAPDAEQVGGGRQSHPFWGIYGANPLAPNGRWNPEKPFALKIYRLMDLPGKKIVKIASREMRGQGFADETRLADRHARLLRIFPDSRTDPSTIGVRTASAAPVFLLGETEIGRIDDPGFAERFVGIRLSEKIMEPESRAELMGIR